MNRAHMVRAAWYAVKTGDGRPSRRRIQAVIKAATGKCFDDHEVAAWMQANQYLGEDQQPYIHDSAMFVQKKPPRARVNVGSKVGCKKPSQNGSTTGLTPLSHQSNTSLTPATNEKTPISSAKESQSTPEQHQSNTSYADQKQERLNIKDGVLHTPSSRVRVCDATKEEKNRETTRTSTEDVKPATALPIFESGDEARVQRLLGAMAAEAGGAPLDEAALRTAMHRVLGAVGPERWRYGMEIAVVAEHAGLGNRWRYAQGVMKRHKLDQGGQARQNGKPRGGAAPRHSITPERKAEIDAWAAELDVQGQRAYEARVEARRKAVASD